VFSLKKLSSLYQSGQAAPLTAKKKSSLLPWELYQRVFPKSPYSFFFDSLRFAPPAQRYSYLGWQPYLRASYQDKKFILEGERNQVIENPNLTAELRKIFKDIKIPSGWAPDFFTGGGIGYLGYELANEFEPISFRPKKGPATPDLGFLFFHDLMAFDHKEDQYILISWLIPKKGVSFREAYARAQKKLQEMKEVLKVDSKSSNGHFRFLRFRPEISKSNFETMVKKTKRYIEAGDIYQANLSQRFSFDFDGSPLRLYGRLRETNPSPFSAAFRWNDLFIASSSPELLVSKKGRLCVTCPIAGTRPRGRNQRESQKLARELLSNEKERAEHLMLVDLERNDLGRVSEWRSVRVKDFMRLEPYARVQHIVSEITSRLRPAEDAWDLIRAMFPGGTITGCPKIRSMQIIDELEPVRRGIYTGSLGYVGFDGNLMMNIAIRTLVLLGKKGYFQVGAGIVADSDPEREYEETLAKGEALAEALVEASFS